MKTQTHHIKLALLSIAFLGTFNSQAQNEDDALRYSQSAFGGTARSVSMAGAFGALGSDFSTLSINPGGIGLYKRSEFTFSPAFFSGMNKASYMGENNTDDKFAFNFGNIGFILADTRDSKSDKWKGFGFGFGYNRMSDFGYRSIIRGINTQNSLLDEYVLKSNGKDPGQFDPFSTELAWNTYLINPVDSNGSGYYSEMPSNIPKYQTKSIETRGGMGETVFSFGGNYDNKLFVGGTLGIQRIRFWQDVTYSEEPVTDTLALKGFTMTNYLNTMGSGLNCKFGLIYMPVTFLRIGASIHSPTFFSLTDDYSSGMTSTFSNGDTYQIGMGNEGGPKGNFRYRLKTPMRATGSLGIVIREIGALSVDYEFVDYREARIRANGYTFSEENSAITNKYKSAGNLRVGGELKLSPFSLRAGYALYGSPFKNEALGGDKQFITGGAGYRENNFFLDLGFITSAQKSSQYLYDSVVNPVSADVKTQSWTFIATLGFKL